VASEHRVTTFYKMVSSLRVEDRLVGATNFGSWKTRILFMLDGNKIQNYVKEYVSEPKSAKEKARHKKNEAKAKRILIDSIKYHLIPHIADLKTCQENVLCLGGFVRE
jgi:hypothetical protein